MLTGCASLVPEWRAPGSPTAAQDAASRSAAARAWESSGSPADATHCVAYAEALRASSHDEDAHDLLTRALIRYPYCVEFHELRGDVAAELGFHRSAQSDYETALRLRPARAELWRKLGETRLALRLRNAARGALQRGIELDPNVPRLHELLAIAEGLSGDDLQAARTFARALELREHAVDAPPCCPADLARAVVWSERAELREPGCAEASYLRGRLIEAQGRGDEAGLAYALALSKDPRCEPAVERLARLRSVTP